MDFETRVDATVDDAIAANRIVGAVTIVARDGEIIYRKAAGLLDRETGQQMYPEAIFRLASITKPIVAATALAMIERNLLGLDNAVADHLPWFRPKLADGREPKITIRHLLTHTSGLRYADIRGRDIEDITSGLEATDLTLEENFTLWAGRIPLAFEPGTAWAYGPSIDVLGAVIERIHDGRLAAAVEHYVTGPLDMPDTGFAVTNTSRLAVAYAPGPPPHRMDDPEVVIGADGAPLTFSPSRIFNAKAFQSGGAGAVGTADDLIKFFDAIRNRGTPILKPDTVAHAIVNQIGGLSEAFGRQGFGFFGEVLSVPAAAGRPQAPGTIRWGGVYGHDWFIDFANGITALMMTNTAIEGNSGRYPADLARAIYGE